MRVYEAITKSKNLICRYGIINFLKGVLKTYYYKHLIKVYKFDQWHITPIELRIYAMECVKLINKITKEKEWTHVVEIGCGIGNILRKVKVKNKTGYDISPSAIRAAIFLAKKNKIKYLVGSFNNVKNECFDCLITVNFMHEIPINMLKEFYNNILTDNEIEYLIVDTVGDSYKYQHNFDAILPDNYKKEVVICPFQSGRYLNLYKKQ